MSNTIVLKPEGGVDYPTRKMVVAAFRRGEIFVTEENGVYTDIEDFYPGQRVILRYRNKRAATIFTIREGDHAIKGL